jgi:hypothetical protein
MGGVGYDVNIATGMVEEQRPYTSILLPLGLIQFFRDWDRFDPNDPRFDPILAMEYAANPLHVVFHRDPGGPRGRFIEKAIDGELSRDLNDYRGFVPQNELLAEGLVAPSIGGTIKFYQRRDGTFHGIYVGAGPYLSARTDLDIDPGLTAILGSPTPVSAPNRSFLVTDASSGQVALSVTGGYRGRIAWPGRKSAQTREGLYIGANYHYLYGFRHESADIRVRFDTDATGLITLFPTTAPIAVDVLEAKSGRGFALDLGVAAVIENWEFGFGANGIGNRIDWTKFNRKLHSLQSLIEGGDFIETPLPVPTGKLRVELPVNYVGNLAYHRGGWTAMSDFRHGFQGFSFHGGLERRLGPVELRGGGRYSRERWHPTMGLGLNLSERFSLDFAAFETSTNIENTRKLGLAASIRLNSIY